MIAFSGVFTLILNTIAEYRISAGDYYHAVRSMGANTWDVIRGCNHAGRLTGSDYRRKTGHQRRMDVDVI